jgi:hypothetical protein
MSKEQATAWHTFSSEAPWLNYSHRALVEIACVVRARLASGGDVGAGALNLLRQCLGQMGATPSSNVMALDPADEDDALFNRPASALHPI